MAYWMATPIHKINSVAQSEESKSADKSGAMNGQ